MMVLKGTDFFLTFVIVVLMPQMGYSCRCPPRYIQNEVCSAEFVFFGTVDSYSEDSTNTYHHLTVTKNLKGTFHTGSSAKINTGSISGSCTLKLEQGKHYLMVGRDDTVRQCFGRAVKTKDLTFQQLLYLVQCPRRKQYLRNCRCKVVDNADELSPNSCLAQNNCFDKKALCVQRRGQCRWTPPQICQ